MFSSISFLFLVWFNLLLFVQSFHTPSFSTASSVQKGTSTYLLVHTSTVQKRRKTAALPASWFLLSANQGLPAKLPVVDRVHSYVLYEYSFELPSYQHSSHLYFRALPVDQHLPTLHSILASRFSNFNFESTCVCAIHKAATTKDLFL